MTSIASNYIKHINTYYEQSQSLIYRWVIKMWISNLVRMTLFWNNFHQVLNIKILENQINLNCLEAIKLLK